MKRRELSAPHVATMAFAAAAVFRICVAGARTWPEAALDMVIVFALPLLEALERMKPEATVELAKTVVERFGAVAAHGCEPSKYDDHREDSLAPC